MLSPVPHPSPFEKRPASWSRRLVGGWFARPHPAPIFLLGNQKSGTTAVGALLAGLTGLPVTLDFHQRNRPAIPLLLNGFLSFAKFVRMHRLEFSRPLIKDPNLSLCFPQLTEQFAQSRFVMILRDPRDNIRSILNRLKLPGHLPALQPEHTARLRPGWKLLLDGSWLGLTGRNYIEMLAQRWNRIANTYLEHREQMISIRYEDFLQDKAGSIAGLARQLGLQPVHDITDRLDVQYQPRGNREVKWDDFFGPDNLEHIHSICRRNMLALQYPMQAPAPCLLP